MNIYEMYGRQAEQHQDAVVKSLNTLELLRDLKAGKFSLDQVVVDRNGWNVTANPSDPSN